MQKQNKNKQRTKKKIFIEKLIKKKTKNKQTNKFKHRKTDK